MSQSPDPTSGQSGPIPLPRVVELREHYRRAMFDDVIPWWLRHSLDRENGGYYGHLGRDGTPYSTDKYMWTTGRQVWMFSHLYNTHEQRPEWLEAARLGADFMLEHGFRENGKMHFRLTRQGESRSEALSTYTEVFGSIAMAEYSKATGDDRLWDRAVAIYDYLIPRLGRPNNTPMLGYPLDAEIHLHAHDMCRITVSWVFDEVRPHDRFIDDLEMSAKSIIDRHWKPDGLPGSAGGVLLENVAMDGSPMLDIAECRMFHPGHAIESAWMMMEIALKQDNAKLFDTSVDIMLTSLKHGWDEKYGGIRYITNYDWTPTHDLGADLKLWWPHSEALYALLLAWTCTGREDVGRWYEDVHQYTFDHFPDPEHGEWYGYLNRNGSPVWTAKANGWKGCFHLPRVLYRCYQLLDSVVDGAAEV
ncbi:MAG: AGE family epimerase/isomerase [Planctomycetota bacterium]|nr:AGE family epimerase/isomerase [Planctomycetota bacterium]